MEGQDEIEIEDDGDSLGIMDELLNTERNR